MKHQHIVFAVLIGLASLTSCDKLGGGPGDLTIHFGAVVHNQDVHFEVDKYYMPQTGDSIGYSRVDMILSGLELLDEDGEVVVAFPDNYQYISLNGNPTSTTWEFDGVIPRKRIASMRFYIGPDSIANHGDPSLWPAGHALNPTVCGLHWGWAGGYVFAALEGSYRNDSTDALWLYHIGFDDNRMEVNIPLDGGKFDRQQELTLNVNLDELFQGPNTIRPDVNGNSSHSMNDGGLAASVGENLEQAFTLAMP